MRPIPAILAAAGLLAVGGASGAALTTRPDVAAPAERRAGPVEVRTVVVHRTIHVVRHIRRKRPAPAARPAVPAVAAAPAQPVAAAPASRPAPRVVRPLRTRSSSTGGGSGDEHESEGADD
jgi:hypothetical protein